MNNNQSLFPACDHIGAPSNLAPSSWAVNLNSSMATCDCNALRASSEAVAAMCGFPRRGVKIWMVSGPGGVGSVGDERQRFRIFVPARTNSG